ncbi:hypothetical protein BGX12_1022 [Fibrobacter sp. UWR4]|nr:hypothetical protein BGX12_1022 [Fibrobacter sp. UWR4]PZW65084.1 hypothetical protein C8E88_10362 [Fibrobacter sp. UWR1]
MRRLIFTIFFAFAVALYAQKDKSQAVLNDNLNCLLFEDCKNASSDLQEAHKRKAFCKENTVRLNMLILDDYFVVSQQENGKLYPDTIVTKIYSADAIRELPQWVRVYGVKQASPDSILSILKGMYQQNKGKSDREELLISYPLQDKSIYEYKNFISAIKKIGYTKIRLVGFNNEFDAEVYKKLQLQKYSEKQIESWESSRNECNKDWLRIVENKLMYGKRLNYQTISDPIIEPGHRSFAGVKDILVKQQRKLVAIQKKFKNKLSQLKDVKTPEHPDADAQIKVTLKFIIAPEGNISKMEIISSNSQNEEFDQCVFDEVSKWIFEKAEHPTTLTVPFKFDKD